MYHTHICSQVTKNCNSLQRDPAFLLVILLCMLYLRTMPVLPKYWHDVESRFSGGPKVYWQWAASCLFSLAWIVRTGFWCWVYGSLHFVTSVSCQLPWFRLTAGYSTSMHPFIQWGIHSPFVTHHGCQQLSEYIRHGRFHSVQCK